MKFIGGKLVNKPLYQTLDLPPLKCWCGAVVIQFQYFFNKSSLFFLLVTELGFQHFYTHHKVYYNQLTLNP